MSGPTAQILLLEAVPEHGIRTLHGIVAALAGRDDRGTLSVVTTRPLGGSYEGVGRPFLVEFDAVPGDEDPEPDAVAAAFGSRPQASVSISALANRSEDHRVLGDISLAVAERLNGLVAFGGLLLPPAFRNRTHASDDARPAAAELVAGLPGRIVAITYETAGGRTWGEHVGDATFLRAWLGHPDFHMVK
jgi:hypothetical protein